MALHSLAARKALLLAELATLDARLASAESYGPPCAAMAVNATAHEHTPVLDRHVAHLYASVLLANERWLPTDDIRIVLHPRRALPATSSLVSPLDDR